MTNYRFEPFDVKRAMAGETVVRGAMEKAPKVTFAGFNPKAVHYERVAIWDEGGSLLGFSEKGAQSHCSLKRNWLHIRTEIKERPNADIIRAYADGESMEWRRKSHDNSLPWCGFEEDEYSPPIGHDGYDWRIKT